MNVKLDVLDTFDSPSLGVWGKELYYERVPQRELFAAVFYYHCETVIRRVISNENGSKFIKLQSLEEQSSKVRNFAGDKQFEFTGFRYCWFCLVIIRVLLPQRSGYSKTE